MKKQWRLIVNVTGLGLAIVLVFSMGLMAVAASLFGAIFTTTPDGSIVNENVRYTSKLDVYLDGGPPPNAPASAAGLPAGLYVFQVTDPSGKVQLSEDPAKCRIVEVSNDGVIVSLVPPCDLGLGLSCDYTVGNGKNGTTFPCHIQDEPDGVAGPSGRHDTNTDIDHGSDKGAIVVQLMPFLDTPNPGGVYKAWMIPLDRYVANGGDLNELPADRGYVKSKGNILGFKNDPGYGPPRDQIKTDNFKVKEAGPELRVRKFNDLNANGVWDKGEPEIGVDQLVDGGGWPISITDPLLVTNDYFTPVMIITEPAGDYVAEEELLPGWQQSAAFLDGIPLGAVSSVTVTVEGLADEMHEVVFGNFEPTSPCPEDYRYSILCPPSYEWDPYPDIFRSWNDVYFVNNSPMDKYNVTATITCAPVNVTVLDGTVSLGDILAYSGKWSLDYFVLEVNMNNPQDPDKGICWTVEYDDAAGNHHVVENVAKFCGEECSNICP